MIGALVKQEFLSSRKGLTAIFGGTVFLVGACCLMIWLKIAVISDIFVVISVLTSALLVLGVLAFLGYNYWQTMYGRQGYFTMSLPVRGRQVYWVKALFAMAVTFVASAVAFLGVLATFHAQGIWDSLWEAFANEPMGQTAVYLILGSFVGQMIILVLEGTAVMSIGAQGKFNRLGFGAAVLGWFILYLVNQILSLITLLVIPVSVSLVGPDAGKIVGHSMWSEMVDVIATGGSGQVTVLGLGSLPATVLLCTGVVWWGIRSIERHTSLR